jgi:ATP-dependent exoDNAse (exonuclease V) alpha subunit
MLMTRFDREADKKDIPKLFSHNRDVDTLNDAELGKINTRHREYKMTHKGPAGLVAQLEKGCLSPETLCLKVGARVMFTKNNFEDKFVNGTLGKVVGFSKTNGCPEVETDTGIKIEVRPLEWAIEENNKTLASISQIPLRLAWAITIHKSQGMSLDSARMDLGHTFEYGQGYVALSRVRTLAGLYLMGINRRALEVHPDIQSADIDFRESSEKAENTFSALKDEEMNKLHMNFIRASGSNRELAVGIDDFI